MFYRALSGPAYSTPRPNPDKITLIVRYAYPLMLDVSQRLVVVIGGGGVAVRKVRGVLNAGATAVRVVAPKFHPDLPAEAQRIIETYRPAHLDGAGLVFAATDSAAVNDAVVRDARERGVLVSRADADENPPGDFTTPARFNRGPVTVNVSADGNPALAVVIRDGLAQRFDPAWMQMAEVMSAFRARVLASDLDASQRRRVFLRMASPQAMEILARQGQDALWQWIGEDFPELFDEAKILDSDKPGERPARA